MKDTLHTEILTTYLEPYWVCEEEEGKLRLQRAERSSCPLIMLHGWQQSLENLRLLGTLVAQGREVHLVDLPGFGHSKAPEAAWSTYDYADHLIDYLDKKGLQEADLFGHSFGGKVAMCLAIKYPKRVRNLILTSASGLKKRRGFISALRYHSLRTAAKGLKLIDRYFNTNCFKSYFAPRFGSKDYQQAGAMRSILVRSVNDDLTGDVNRIQARTLLLWGKEDDQTPLEIATRLNRAIAGSKLVTLEHKGHMPFEDVGAHLCAKVILSFLRNESSSKAEVVC